MGGKRRKQTQREREIAALVKEQQGDRRRDWLLTRPRSTTTKTTRYDDERDKR